MKLASISWQGEQRIVVSTDAVSWNVIDRSAGQQSRDLLSLIEDVTIELQRLPFAAEVNVDAVTFLAPLKHVEKILCVGKNFSDHAKEMQGAVPTRPIIFSKFSSALIGPHDKIVLPAVSNCVDYEAELVAVIGRAGRNIPIENALDHVFGYCIGNDITARDWQKSCPERQWLLGKTFDTFAPIGPYIVTANEINHPIELEIRLSLNGQVMQQSNTRYWIFKLDELIAHVSQIVTLKPGDLIFTGTPAGVGAGRTPPVFLKAGDCVVVEIDGLGQLENTVVAESSASN